MQITQVRIEGFKAFRENQTIDLAECNLLYGENSAGKSTISQAIRLLRQNFTTLYSGESPVIDFRSPDNDLGGYGTAVYRHTVSNEMSIGITINPSERLSTFLSAASLLTSVSNMTQNPSSPA